MLRCASSFVTSAYEKVRLMTQYLRALPADLFYAAVDLSDFISALELE